MNALQLNQALSAPLPAQGLTPPGASLTATQRAVLAVMDSAMTFIQSDETGARAPHRARRVAKVRSSAATQTAVCPWNPECSQVRMPTACSSLTGARRTNNWSTAWF